MIFPIHPRRSVRKSLLLFLSFPVQIGKTEIQAQKPTATVSVTNSDSSANGKITVTPVAYKGTPYYALVAPSAIELGAHTDIRGTNRYNNQLSERRASATIAYLVRKGIDPKRISAKYFGKKNPLLECGTYIKCSKKIHQINRRVAFTIVTD